MFITTWFGSRLSAYVISLSLADGMLLGAVFYFLFYFLFFKKLSNWRNLWIGLLFVYVGALISLTLPIVLPAAWRVSAEGTAQVLRAIQWRPLESSLRILRNCLKIGTLRPFYRLILGNFVMLMPLGVLVPLVNPRFKLLRMTALSLAAAFTVEGLQLMMGILSGSMVRTVEIDDFILNSTGCLLAYLVFFAIRGVYRCFAVKAGKRARRVKA